MRLVVAALVLCALTSSSFAEFGPNEDKSCVESCQKNPTVPYSSRSKCPAHCACVSAEANKIFKPGEQDQLLTDLKTNKDSLNVKRYKSLIQMCGKRTLL